MRVRRAEARDEGELAMLVAGYRVELAEFRGQAASVTMAQAKSELGDYRRRKLPVFVAESGGGKLAGYLVCRVEGRTVWAESLFVMPQHRRKGVASALYAEAERLAEELGSDTVYNCVHPNNDAVIAFLARRGYSVLNLVELRRARHGEKPSGKISVGKHQFDY
jgi:ribosomal protein S18 acetylase RimI-like enzyme